MYSISPDVYTSYPDISRALPLVSKQLSQLSIRGACNSLISKEELTKYMDDIDYSKFGLLTTYDVDYYSSRIDMFVLDKFVGFFLKDDDWIRFEGNIIETDEIVVNKIKVSDDVDLFFPTDFIHYIRTNEEYSAVYADINTTYQIFSKREICKQYPNYAKEMTKEYFNYILEQLDNHKPSLYLYLISNVMILNLDVSRDTLGLLRPYPDEDIDEYQKRVQSQMNDVIDEVINYMNIM